MNYSFNALLKVPSMRSTTFSLIILYGNVVHRIEKSYLNKLVQRNPLHFNLLNTSLEFEVSYTVPQYFITSDLMAVRRENNNKENLQ